MRYAELLELAPGLRDFTAQIPEDLDGGFQLRTCPPPTPSSTRRTAPWSASASCCGEPSGW